MYKRIINLLELLNKKSFFLYGPRGTGKSYLIRETLGDLPKIDLLDSSQLILLASNPSNIIRLIPENAKFVVIDEFQKLPELLNEVHRLIEQRGIHFLLTGSSTRKLKKAGVNLLGGRARTQFMFPLTSRELADDFDLERYLKYGGLPAVYQSAEPEEDLFAYVDNFIKDEIMIEAQLRNLPQFSRFLKVAALSNGQLLKYASIGSDSEISASTVREYFYLLQDTMMGFLVEPWRESKKRKAIQMSKFYFFDTGVTRALLKSFEIPLHSQEFGVAFEHFIAKELRAYLNYSRKSNQLCFWRTKTKEEVDFVIPDEVAVEVKAADKLNEKKHLNGLIKLQEEKCFKKYYFISNDPHEQTVNNVVCLPWHKFLKLLWQGDVF